MEERDLHFVVWWQDLARETNTRLGGISVRAWIVSVTTIAMCLLAMVVDTRDPLQRRKS